MRRHIPLVLLAVWVVLSAGPAAGSAGETGRQDFLNGLALEYQPAAGPDYQGARDHYEKAAAAGYGPALTRLSRLSAPEGPLWRDTAVWAGYLSAAVRAGQAEAAYELAQALDQGRITSREAEGLSPAELYLQAALQGHGPAAFSLANLFLAGDEAADRRAGEMWLAVAAETETPGAALALGRRLFESDPPAAERWLRQESGAEALYLLGRLLLEHGREVEGAAYYEAAAQEGYPEANLALGLLALDDTFGRRANIREAFQNFKAAAQAGLPEGAYQLGLMFARGQGTPKDIITGAYWLHQAAVQGHPEARKDYENLIYGFSEGQRRRLERMIDENAPPLSLR